jgi:hypothetical protein
MAETVIVYLSDKGIWFPCNRRISLGLCKGNFHNDNCHNSSLPCSDDKIPGNTGDYRVNITTFILLLEESEVKECDDTNK